MTRYQALTTLFLEESNPSPLKVGVGLAEYFEQADIEGRRDYKDDLAVLELLETNGFGSPYKRAASCAPQPMRGNTPAEKAMFDIIGNAQICLHINRPAGPHYISALRYSS